MKFFGNTLATIAAVAMGVVSAFAQSENAVINAIQTVSDASATLQVSVSELTFTNWPLKGTEVAAGLKELTLSVVTFTKDLRNPPRAAVAETFSNEAAEEIVKVLTGFVAVHQALLSTIIGKHGIAERFAATRPIAIALRSLEAVVDTFAFDIIALIPTQQSNAQVQINSLDVTFGEVLQTYRS